MDVSAYLPFLLLLTAVIGLWMHRVIWIGALLAAIVAGYFSGALHGLAALWIALLAVLALAYHRVRKNTGSPNRPVLQALVGFLFFSYALTMGLALLPGFTRVVLVDAAALSPGAAPYDIAVGFPKVVTGILILGLINPVLVRSWGELGRVLARAAPVFAITALVALAAVLLMGYTTFAPKWTAIFLLWAPINLFFTCLSEEAFFRGFVQQELARVGSRPALAGGFALGIAAVLFGLAHFAGGPLYVVAAAIAGVGYGWAFMRTGRIEGAMAVHFGVNATHFLLFTYPRLA
jgi:membrane protease YdiL (CAAX protease family)